jgi:hemerythrin-like domain-containing protein
MDDATVMRDRLVATGREFIAAQRAHLQREERELLPRAEQQLSDADWDVAAGTAGLVSDPLDATAMPARYQSLYAAICAAH